MSTGHIDHGPTSQIAFETRDFYRYLRCMGYDLQALRTDGRRQVFVFLDRPSGRPDVLTSFGGGAAVPPLAFSPSIKHIEALLHNV